MAVIPPCDDRPTRPARPVRCNDAPRAIRLLRGGDRGLQRVPRQPLAERGVSQGVRDDVRSYIRVPVGRVLRVAACVGRAVDPQIRLVSVRAARCGHLDDDLALTASEPGSGGSVRAGLSRGGGSIQGLCVRSRGGGLRGRGGSRGVPAETPAAEAAAAWARVFASVAAVLAVSAFEFATSAAAEASSPAAMPSIPARVAASGAAATAMRFSARASSWLSSVSCSPGMVAACLIT